MFKKKLPTPRPLRRATAAKYFIVLAAVTVEQKENN